MNEPVKLEPCPFCGSKYVGIIIPIEKEYQVQCGDCYASSSIESTVNKAIKAWNRRAERTGRWVPVVNTWTQDEHVYGATWYKCDQCGRLCETKQPYCHCGAHMIEGEEND